MYLYHNVVKNVSSVSIPNFSRYNIFRDGTIHDLLYDKYYSDIKKYIAIRGDDGLLYINNICELLFYSFYGYTNCYSFLSNLNNKYIVPSDIVKIYKAHITINGEIFKYIPETKSYFINKYGCVYSSVTKQILAHAVNHRGYKIISITFKGNMRYTCKISRLIYMAWNNLTRSQISNMTIHHIDSNITHDDIDNLKLLSSYDNIMDSVYNKYHSSALFDIDEITLVCKFMEQNLSSEQIALRLNSKYTNRQIITLIDRIKNGGWRDISEGFNIRNFSSHQKEKVAKLDDVKVKRIRELIGEGLSNTEIANLFKVNNRTISAIKLNQTWKNIT